MKLFFQLNKDKRLQGSDIKGGDKRTKVSLKCTFVAVNVFPPFLWANFVFKSSFPCDVDESLSTNRFISLFRKFFISRRLHFEHAVMCHKYIQKLPIRASLRFSAEREKFFRHRRRIWINYQNNPKSKHILRGYFSIKKNSSAIISFYSSFPTVSMTFKSIQASSKYLSDNWEWKALCTFCKKFEWLDKKPFLVNIHHRVPPSSLIA